VIGANVDAGFSSSRASPYPSVKKSRASGFPVFHEVRPSSMGFAGVGFAVEAPFAEIG
jgi:hypothetical protein